MQHEERDGGLRWEANPHYRPTLIGTMEVRKFINHSKRAIQIATRYGWYPGARYTNMRDVKTFPFKSNGFLDIDWKNYDLQRHLDVASTCEPYLTIARDVEDITELDSILKEAELLSVYSKKVAIVPKDTALEGRLSELIPNNFMLAYSVPSKYGHSSLGYSSFDREVHLLGGRPDIQREAANYMNVVSIDCNRFTYDSRFGDYFDGETFRPHPKGGYENCLKASIANINELWVNYNYIDRNIVF